MGSYFIIVVYRTGQVRHEEVTFIISVHTMNSEVVSSQLVHQVLDSLEMLNSSPEFLRAAAEFPRCGWIPG